MLTQQKAFRLLAVTVLLVLLQPLASLALAAKRVEVPMSKQGPMAALKDKGLNPCLFPFLRDDHGRRIKPGQARHLQGVTYFLNENQKPNLRECRRYLRAEHHRRHRVHHKRIHGHRRAHKKAQAAAKPPVVIAPPTPATTPSTQASQAPQASVEQTAQPEAQKTAAQKTEFFAEVGNWFKTHATALVEIGLSGLALAALFILILIAKKRRVESAQPIPKTPLVPPEPKKAVARPVGPEKADPEHMTINTSRKQTDSPYVEPADKIIPGGSRVKL